MKTRLIIAASLGFLAACAPTNKQHLTPLPDSASGIAASRTNGQLGRPAGKPAPIVAFGQESGTLSRKAPGDAGGPFEPMTLNFVDADIRQIATTILGEGLKVGYTIDPQVRGTATIRTDKPMERDELLATLQTLLLQNGATLIVENGLYRVTPVNANGISGPVLGEDGVGSGTVIVPLTYASAPELVKVLEPFVGAGAKVAADASRNTLMINGEPTARAGILDLVRAFDTDYLRRQSYAVFPVVNGDASAAANDLAQAMGATPDGPLGKVVRVTALKRANAVLVVAPQRRTIDDARRLFSMVDKARDVSSRTWHVYYVRNSQVADLERVLQSAFGSDRNRSASETTTQTAPGFESSTSGFPSNSMQGGFNSQNSPAQGGNAGGSITPGTATGGSSAQGGTGGGNFPTSTSTLEPPSVLSPATDSLSSPTGGGEAKEGVRIVGNRANNALLIYSTAEEQETIDDMLRKLDILPLQVRIDATIAEVTLNDNLSYGTQFFFQNGGIATALSTATSGAINGAFPGFVVSRGTGSARFAISALQEVTNVRILSSPQIVALDNQPAFLQVGDTVPYVSQQAVSTQNPDSPIVNSIQYRDTGVILQVTPRVNSGGLVSLDIAQEVSDVTATNTSGIDSPTFPQRRIKSRVVVEDGQTIGLAGLIRDSATEGNSGIPGLKNIPILGSLFGTQDNTRKRTELLVMITPHVIHDQRDARALTEDMRQNLEGPAMVQQQLDSLPQSGSSNPNAAVGAPSVDTVEIKPPRSTLVPTRAQPSGPAPQPLAPQASVSPPVQAAPRLTQTAPASASVQQQAAVPTPTVIAAPAMRLGGTSTIQVSAATSANEASDIAAGVSRRNAELLGGLKNDIEKVTIAGTDHWRVRYSGLADRKEATRLCKELVLRSQPCLVVN